MAACVDDQMFFILLHMFMFISRYRPETRIPKEINEYFGTDYSNRFENNLAHRL